MHDGMESRKRGCLARTTLYQNPSFVNGTASGDSVSIIARRELRIQSEYYLRRIVQYRGNDPSFLHRFIENFYKELVQSYGNKIKTRAPRYGMCTYNNRELNDNGGIFVVSTFPWQFLRSDQNNREKILRSSFRKMTVKKSFPRT
jgi:hypothetical protein